MALNFSQRPIFPAHTSEDNLVSPLRNVNGYVMEGMPERGEFFRPQYVNNRELQDCFHYGRDVVDRGGSPESVSRDIIDRLPLDPFGMNISAITELLENFDVDYGWYVRNNLGSSRDDYGLYAGFNLFWNSMRFQPFPGNLRYDDNFDAAFGGNQDAAFGGNQDAAFGGNQDAAVSGSKTDKVFCFDSGNTSTLSTNPEESLENFGSFVEDGGAPHEAVENFDSSDEDGGAPHEALVFALSHLGLGDLIHMEQVCRSLRSTVRTDPLLWRNVHVDKPLNGRITDDVLLHLTSRAQGSLQSLSLVQCPRITDDGLRHVLETNPKLTKLCVPGCTRLSIDGVMNILRAFKSSTATTFGIRCLRIGGLYGVTLEHFEDLKVLLGVNSNVQCKGLRPHYHIPGKHYLLCDDDRAIDIEICPKCEKLGVVYDCTAESCQSQDQSADVCRACKLCIARCYECGRCIKDVYEETFSLDKLCADCMMKVPECEGKPEMEGDLGQKDDPCDQSSDICFYG